MNYIYYTDNKQRDSEYSKVLKQIKLGISPKNFTYATKIKYCIYLLETKRFCKLMSFVVIDKAITLYELDEKLKIKTMKYCFLNDYDMPARFCFALLKSERYAELDYVLSYYHYIFLINKKEIEKCVWTQTKITFIIMHNILIDHKHLILTLVKTKSTNAYWAIQYISERTNIDRDFIRSLKLDIVEQIKLDQQYMELLNLNIFSENE